jgi:hypothetical protein
MQFGWRGTEVATYSLAKYNEEILGNKSIIIGTSKREMDSYNLFADKFKTILLEEDWSPIDNSKFRTEIEKHVEREKADWYYVQIGGEKDTFFPTNCKTFIHAVFNMRCPQGNVYAGISEYLMARDGGKLFLPYIVERPYNHNIRYRKPFNIPDDAIVLGRHGGLTTFDIPFVHNTIKRILSVRNDIYFFFLGTNEFFEHPNIIHWDITVEPVEKQIFLNSCDAMLHARSVGETFGLACAEFSVSNKPVITYSGNLYPYYDRSHIYILGSKGIYYQNEEELYNYLLNLKRKDLLNKDWNAYQDFSGEKVIRKFEQLIA